MICWRGFRWSGRSKGAASARSDLQVASTHPPAETECSFYFIVLPSQPIGSGFHFSTMLSGDK